MRQFDWGRVSNGTGAIDRMSSETKLSNEPGVVRRESLLLINWPKSQAILAANKPSAIAAVLRYEFLLSTKSKRRKFRRRGSLRGTGLIWQIGPVLPSSPIIRRLPPLRERCILRCRSSSCFPCAKLQASLYLHPSSVQGNSRFLLPRVCVAQFLNRIRGVRILRVSLRAPTPASNCFKLTSPAVEPFPPAAVPRTSNLN